MRTSSAAGAPCAGRPSCRQARTRCPRPATYRAHHRAAGAQRGSLPVSLGISGTMPLSPRRSRRSALYVASTFGASLVLVTCEVTRPPVEPCAARPADVSIADEVARAADAAGFDVVPCERGAYGLVRRDTRELTTSDGDLACKEHLADELLALEGVTGVGLNCCRAVDGRVVSGAGCVAVFLDRGTPAATLLPTVLARRLAVPPCGNGDAAVRIAVEQGPARVPRCDAGEPGCGPIAYDLPSACVDLPRTTGWSRRPVARFGPAPRTPLTRCTHDGECQTCNAVCTSFRAGSIVCTQEKNNLLRGASCGCLEGRCSWFTLAP
jgi:hypothetical protein